MTDANLFTADLEHVRFFDDGDGVYAIFAMEAHPEIAQRVGIIMAAFATLEITCRDLLARMLNVSQAAAGDILWELRTQDKRLNKLLSVANAQPDSPLKSRIRTLAVEIDWLRKARNDYAHSQFAVLDRDDSRSLYRIGYFSDLRHETSVASITTEQIDEDIARAKALAVELWELLRR